eukprot:11080848-Alexandrium_andersonii.AAC.1
MAAERAAPTLGLRDIRGGVGHAPSRGLHRGSLRHRRCLLVTPAGGSTLALRRGHPRAACHEDIDLRRAGQREDRRGIHREA